MWIKKIPMRYVQVFVNIWTVVLGMCVFIPLAAVWKYFNSVCILFSNTQVTIDSNGTVNMDLETSEFGMKANCYFSTFMCVVAAIHAFIWCWFFLHMKQATNDEGRETTLLIPALFTHILMFVCVFASSALLTAGVGTFCGNLEDNLQNAYTCSELQDMEWDVGHPRRSFYSVLVVGQVFSWFTTISILIQCIVTGLKGYKTSVIRLAKSETSDTSSIGDHNTSKYSIQCHIDELSGSMVFPHGEVESEPGNETMNDSQLDKSTAPLIKA